MKTNNQPTIEYIFVYGTLMRGMENPVKETLKRHLAYKGAGIIRADLFDLGEYPGAIKNEKGNQLYGEVYQLDIKSDVLRVLDEYEGYCDHDVNNAEFVRAAVEVAFLGKSKVWAWIYWLNPTFGHFGIKILNKSYRSHLKTKIA